MPRHHSCLNPFVIQIPIEGYQFETKNCCLAAMKPDAVKDAETTQATDPHGALGIHFELPIENSHLINLKPSLVAL